MVNLRSNNNIIYYSKFLKAFEEYISKLFGWLIHNPSPTPPPIKPILLNEGRHSKRNPTKGFEIGTHG